MMWISYLHLFHIPERHENRGIDSNDENYLLKMHFSLNCGNFVFSSLYFHSFSFSSSTALVVRVPPESQYFLIFRPVWGSFENKSTNFLSVTAPDRYPSFLLEKPIPKPNLTIWRTEKKVASSYNFSTAHILFHSFEMLQYSELSNIIICKMMNFCLLSKLCWRLSFPY